MRLSWMGPDPVVAAHERLREHWAAMQADAQARAAVEREQWESNWGELQQGDAVLLGHEVSRSLLPVFDEEGRQIRLDGVIEALMVQQALVRVMLECGKFGMPMVSQVVMVGPQDVEATEGVHAWGRLSARWHEKRRRGEAPGESPYWVN